MLFPKRKNTVIYKFLVQWYGLVTSAHFLLLNNYENYSFIAKPLKIVSFKYSFVVRPQILKVRKNYIYNDDVDYLINLLNILKVSVKVIFLLITF